MFLRFKSQIRGGTLVREETDPAIIARLLAKNWEEFTPVVAPPVVVEPEEVPSWALRAALIQDGSLAQVTAAIATLPGLRRIVAEQLIAGNGSILRRSRLTLHIRDTVPFTGAKLTQLFDIANQIAEGKLGN